MFPSHLIYLFDSFEKWKISPNLILGSFEHIIEQKKFLQNISMGVRLSISPISLGRNVTIFAGLCSSSLCWRRPHPNSTAASSSFNLHFENYDRFINNNHKNTYISRPPRGVNFPTNGKHSKVDTWNFLGYDFTCPTCPVDSTAAATATWRFRLRVVVLVGALLLTIGRWLLYLLLKVH